jgi:hypothetical protein
VVKVGTGLGGNAAMDHAFFRNNLAIGGADGGRYWGGFGAGNQWGADIPDPGTHSSFDYDAVGVAGVPYMASIGGRDFSLVEKNGIGNLVLAETFAGVEFPVPPVPARAMPDLRPRAGAKVVDAAQPIPNVNDGFQGMGPDIGAYEAGQPLPHYGPRPPGVEEGEGYGQGTLGGAPAGGGRLGWQRARGGIRVDLPPGHGGGTAGLYDLRGRLRESFPVPRDGRELWIPRTRLPGGLLLLRFREHRLILLPD